ncbi:MAG: hypothetical protein AAFV88_10040 [Planctomycetota bacterium]
MEDRLELLASDCLSATEEQDLLRELETDSEHYRTLALLLLEERRWERSFAACNGTATTASASAFLFRSRQTVLLFASAACLLVAFLAGHSWRSDLSDDDSFAAMNASTNRTGETQAVSELFDSDAIDSTVLGVAEWENLFGPQASPLYAFDQVPGESELSADTTAAPPELPSSVLRDLRRAGWSIEQTQTLVTIRLVGGQRLSLPLTDYRYRYIGREIY